MPINIVIQRRREMSLSVKNFVNNYYDQYIAKRTLSSETMQKFAQKHADDMNQRVQSVAKDRDVAASVSISQEGKEKLMGEEAEKAMREGVDLIYKSADKSDVFSLQEGDKWQVFTDYLNYTDAYEQMGISKSAVQDAMRGSTVNDGALAGERVYTDGNGRQLDSNELSLLSQSSVAALQKFSDSFLQGETKEGFDELIRQYGAHMSKRLDGYQSVEEEFNHALASLDANAQANLENFREKEGISDSDRVLIGVKEKLGGVTHTQKEQEEYHSTLQNLFRNMNSSNVDDTMEQIRQQYVSYVSGNSEDENVKDYISKQSKWVLGSVEQSWKKLFGLK